MYKSERDLVRDVITAAMGAGIVTSFAVSQGQNPLLALAITGFAAGVAILVEYGG